MKKTNELPEHVRQIQEASDIATWDAIEAYRDTGEMVPVAQDGKLAFLTVDEALRSRPDYGSPGGRPPAGARGRPRVDSRGTAGRVGKVKELKG